MERIPNLTQQDWEFAEALEGFTNEFLLDRYDEPRPTPAFHRELWALFLSEHRQCSAAAPRGHAKSTAITFAYVLFRVCFRSCRHLLILSSNETNAAQFINEIKVELAENERLRQYMEFHKFKKETETELIFEFKDGSKSRVIGRGTDQKIRGLKWERKRPDEILMDDCEDEEMVLNEARRDKFLKNMYGAIKPIVRNNGRIRAVGTIIGFGSFLEGTMPNEKLKDTVIEPLRVYSTGIHPWMSVKYRAHDHDMTEFLWPELHTLEWWLQERRDFADRGILDIYGQEYLNNPIDETTGYFRVSDLVPMTDEDRSRTKEYYVGVDLAIGETDRSAYTAFVIGGVDSDGILHIVDVRKGRWDALEILEEFFAVQKAYEPSFFRVESENIAKSIGPVLYNEMGKNGNPFINIDDAPPTKDKDKRARGMQARTRARRVRFDKDADWYPDFEEEITKFPKYAYKDQFDAFAWLGLIVDEMIEPPTSEEAEEWEYQEAFEKHMDLGRNMTTGY
jgi:predicted phage terminase large subunit-like protein